LKPGDCILLLDFSGADLSLPETVAEIIVASYQRVMEIGLWHRVVFQATSYPEKNPAIAGGQALMPRNEWRVWKHATLREREVARNLVFGDFSADSSKLVFDSGGGVPIKHYRYSTVDDWLVIRAADEKRTPEAMREVSSRIVKSEYFAGRSFSHGDAYIDDTANGTGGPGNATTWRKVNTIHHLTRVVKDLGELIGYTIPDLVLAPPPTQPSLFDFEDATK
jgi:Beta protein